ncbi:MAG: hypothetical protein Q4B31_01350, partial [Clostridia bacterium]|nr:hypothetical protein [Clostridia bacterium]
AFSPPLSKAYNYTLYIISQFIRKNNAKRKIDINKIFVKNACNPPKSVLYSIVVCFAQQKIL